MVTFNNFPTSSGLKQRASVCSRDMPFRGRSLGMSVHGSRAARIGREMHPFFCTCGNSILVESPSPNAGYLVWDSDVDASIANRRALLKGFLAALNIGKRDAWMRYFYGTANLDRLRLKSDVDVIEDILSEHDTYTHHCYRCEVCSRLHLQHNPGTEGYDIFRRED